MKNQPLVLWPLITFHCPIAHFPIGPHRSCDYKHLQHFNWRETLIGSRCGSAVKWWKWENKLYREDPGLLPTPGNLF
jgi:hypothetical protein